MPLRWLILMLAVVLAALMSVVLLRAESTRLHYELSQLDRRAAVVRQELREKELELARLRNPAAIRAKLGAWSGRGNPTHAKAPGERRGGP